MAEVTVPLLHGFKVGESIFKTATIREATAGDVIEAQEESEKLVRTVDEKGNPLHEFVPSPTMVGVNVLRRQIKSIDNYSGPLDLDELKSLHPADLNLLQYEADKLDKAAEIAAEGFAKRGESDQSGGID